MSGPVHVESFGSGAPVVFLHGWGLHGGIWSPVAEALTGAKPAPEGIAPGTALPHRQQWSIYLPDLPGHGHSKPLPPDPAAWAAAIADAVPPDATWVGWSLGGLIAMQAALSDRPPKRLVLVGATPRFTRAADWPHAVEPPILAEFARALGDDWRGTLLRFLALQTRGSDRGREELRRLREIAFVAGEPDPAGLAAGLQLLAAVDLREALADIHTPTLVIQGERDVLVPTTAAQAVTDALPDGRLAIIPGAGHAPFLSHPELFVSELEPFLDGR